MEREKNTSSPHLVGIIPIQNGPSNDGYPWPNALTPLYKNYTALHRSVLECATAGCSSIWIIAEKKHIALLKTVIGVYVGDPIFALMPVEFKRNFKMIIPIWYASLPVRDIGRRECYGRSILAGAEYSLKISSNLSRFAMPGKFYVSFPHKIFSPWKLLKNRRAIKSNKTNIYFTFDGKTIKDGAGIGFTFFLEDYKRFVADFKTMDIGSWEYTGSPVGYQDLKLLKRRRPEDSNTAMKLTLDEVFRSAILDDATMFEADGAHDISTWEGYAAYMAAQDSWLRMPKKISYFRFNKLNNLEERLIDCGEYDDYDKITKNRDSIT